MKYYSQASSVGPSETSTLTTILIKTSRESCHAHMASKPHFHHTLCPIRYFSPVVSLKYSRFLRDASGWKPLEIWLPNHPEITSTLLKIEFVYPNADLGNVTHSTGIQQLNFSSNSKFGRDLKITPTYNLLKRYNAAALISSWSGPYSD